MTAKCVLLGFALLAWAGDVAAQTSPAIDAANARAHLGPVTINPTVSLSNFGVDTNVFNEAEDQAPKSDFTTTLTPKADLWLRMGRSWLIGNVTEDLVWYQKYSNQRYLSHFGSLELQVPLNRLLIDSKASLLKTHDRPGFEIDVRSPRRETKYEVKGDLRVRPKTSLGVTADVAQVDYDRDTFFLDASLHNELNRTVRSAGLTLKQHVTPLTTVGVGASIEQARFVFNPLRDSESTLMTGLLSLDPAALIKGNVMVGYRDFKPAHPGIPTFRGLMADVDVAYVGFGSTRITLEGMRDVGYSFEVTQPYYVQTGGVLSIAQHIVGQVDAIARAGVQQFDYQNRSDLAAAITDRTDLVRTYGGGTGYRLNRNMRVGVNIDHQRRTSGVARRQYSGWKVGTAVTYGR